MDTQPKNEMPRLPARLRSEAMQAADRLVQTLTGNRPEDWHKNELRWCLDEGTTGPEFTDEDHEAWSEAYWRIVFSVRSADGRRVLRSDAGYLREARRMQDLLRNTPARERKGGRVLFRMVGE